MNTGLHGKTAIVTGSSKGIGKAIALAFANEGVRLTLCARNENLLTQTENEIKDRFHTEVISIKANVAKLNDIKRTVNKTLNKFKRIDILVNNAGSLAYGGIDEFDDKLFEEHLFTRLLSAIRFAKEVIPIMKRQGGGKIINIAGINGVFPEQKFLINSMINGAILNFTRALALELASDKINVNAVNPFYTNTEQTIQIFNSLAVKENIPYEEIINRFSKIVPMSRFASPDDVAFAVVYLASDSANFLTGISINVNGGIISGTL
ncbi:MAG: 3-oxoacyl-[acyl-carrier protein] reductase [Ignavibacteriae bacterium]|nr:MAG: 3-oxoacyl-[acyl-carrier protein] reductase [Ignavibacteriota bacterium]